MSLGIDCDIDFQCLAIIIVRMAFVENSISIVVGKGYGSISTLTSRILCFINMVLFTSQPNITKIASIFCFACYVSCFQDKIIPKGSLFSHLDFAYFPAIGVWLLFLVFKLSFIFFCLFDDLLLMKAFPYHVLIFFS